LKFDIKRKGEMKLYSNSEE